MNTLLEELKYQYKLSDELSKKFMELSTDCLIETPQEMFEKWKSDLESLKEIVDFLPKFVDVLHPDNERLLEQLEKEMTNNIENIGNYVDEARRSLDNKDIVQFSDVLELKICPWLNSYWSAINTILKAHKQSVG